MAEPIRVMVFTDLDDSLFSTLRKIPPAQRPGIAMAARAVTDKHSFMTRKQTAMLEWLDLSRCIPVTARGTEAYSRVTLPFSGPAAILTNGAVLLDSNGAVDEGWAEKINAILAGMQDSIHALVDSLQQLAAHLSLDIRSWAVVEPSCGAVYAVAKSNRSANGEGLDNLLESLKHHMLDDDAHALENWRFHINGNNLSVTPAGISKAIAVQHLLRELRAEQTLFTVGIGDSASDLEFMRLCDAWLTPSQSQIDRML